MRAVFKREVNAYFKTMLGYVFMAVFLLISGLGFFLNCMVTGEASMSGVFSLLIDTMIILIPILTMRLLSEEKRNKTDQMLLTAPVSITGIVMGKYLAAVFVFVLTSLSTMLYPLIIALFGTPPFFYELLLGYAGFWLLGAALIALGLFISSVTEHQLISMILTVFALIFVLIVIDALIPSVNNSAAASVLKWLSVFNRYITTFDIGIFSLASVMYYLSFSGVFVFLTVRLIERRRWSRG